MPPRPSTCLEIAEAVRAGKTSAAAVVGEAISRTKAAEEKWNPFIRIAADRAQRQAERVDRRLGKGEDLSRAGVPFAVKDLVDVDGLPTACGSGAIDRVAKRDATVVERLEAAGAVPLGKANMHECAFGFTGANPTFGDCRNPWDPQRIPGGSSSGSAAAVAGGVCPLALGSDTGGSTRLPAAFCGVTGLKPTYGRVPRDGAVPLAWTMDHIGTLTRTARDAATVLDVLAGHGDADPSSSRRRVPPHRKRLSERLGSFRVGIPDGWFFDRLDPAVFAAVHDAIDQLVSLGGETVEVRLPRMEEVLGAHRAIIFSEAASAYAPTVDDRAGELGDDIRPLLLGGRFLPAGDYLKGQRVRRIVRREWAKAMGAVDCVATPTVPMPAPPFGRKTVDLGGEEVPMVRACLDLTLPFNLTGHPAITLPCGFSEGNLPLGLQLVAKPFYEPTLLRIAHRYQQATDWHDRRPPLDASGGGEDLSSSP